MAKYQLLLPKMGESVAEATIIKWNKKPGDYIESDETVMEIATDKVDSEVPSPVSGKLIEQLCNENDVVQVGAVIAVIETESIEKKDIEEPVSVAPKPEVTIAEEPKSKPVITEPIPGLEQLEAKSSVGNNKEFKNSERFYSPLVKNIATQEGISVEELDKIPGTGAEGRLTKDDLLNYLQNPSATSSKQETKQPSSITEERIYRPMPEQKAAQNQAPLGYEKKIESKP